MARYGLAPLEEIFLEGLIVLSDREAASNTDILQGTRLQTVPSGGYLTFELQADLADATNNFTVSIQLPDGSTPLNAVLVPGTTAVDIGILDERQKLMVTFSIGQGGHVVFSCVEAGAAVLIWRVTFQPA